mmetsp:Transcript_56514/g.100679  ORF Transcript_56514/g.100679 Transcript_56514/m.100679 type:complete len:108 (+) Transcript_56514:432-755(+)
MTPKVETVPNHLSMLVSLPKCQTKTTDLTMDRRKGQDGTGTGGMGRYNDVRLDLQVNKYNTCLLAWAVSNTGEVVTQADTPISKMGYHHGSSQRMLFNVPLVSILLC